MELRIDSREIEKKKRGRIDPRVKVRFGFLTREGYRLTDQEIDRGLCAKAQEGSEGASLIDLIKRMVKEFAYSQARLSLPEFIERFEKNNLADLIAAEFVNSLYKIDRDPNLNGLATGFKGGQIEGMMEDAEEEVMLNVVAFLEKNNLGSAETLLEFLKQQKYDWPMVDIRKLFHRTYVEIGSDGQKKERTLQEKVAEKIDERVAEFAAKAYEEKFNEDKEGFVMGFMIGRVIKYDPKLKKTVFDPGEFRKLMAYLDSIGCNINRINDQTLYDLLYRDSREMARYVEEQRVNVTRTGVRSELQLAGVLEASETSSNKHDQLFFDPDFDVKKFHDQYIKPAIFRFYSGKLRRVAKVRETDVLHKLNDPENLGQTNYTTGLIRYVRTLIETAKRKPGNFMMKIRDLFGLNNTPLMSRLSNAEVQRYFDFCFDQAEEKFRQTVSDAIAYREDSEIERACVYPEEILKCRDLAKLLEWFENPKIFCDSFPQYSEMPLDQIAFACAAFIRDFLRVSKSVGNKHFREAGRRRDVLETYMKRTLNIRELKVLDIRFRLLEQVDEQGKSLEPKKYELVYNPQDLNGFSNGLDRDLAQLLLSKPEMEELEWKGGKYKVHPVEQKRFKKVKMKIPYMEEVLADKGRKVFDKKVEREVEALIYSGDDHFIHVKPDITRLISQDRGKEISDENRWMLVFQSEADVNSFREFIYATNARNIIKVDDMRERREISNKGGRSARTKSSKKFKQGQELSLSKIFSFPEKAPDGNLQMVDTMLETQCQTLSHLLITNLTDYSDTSHNVYRSQRAWPLLWSLYFPPEYFGDKYKEMKDQGYHYEKKAA